MRRRAEKTRMRNVVTRKNIVRFGEEVMSSRMNGRWASDAPERMMEQGVADVEQSDNQAVTC